MMHDESDDFAWFKAQLPKLMPEHAGKHALLHNRSVRNFYPTSLDAVKVGIRDYGEGNFLVELVDDRIEDLGFFSHVSSTLHA